MIYNQINIPQSIHVTYLEYNPRVHSMTGIPQDDNLGQTLHNPLVIRGWWRIGTLGAKSPKKESPNEENMGKAKNKIISYSLVV
jgi:hypothetical protein